MRKLFILMAGLFLTGCTSLELQDIGKKILVDSIGTAINQEVRNQVGSEVTCKLRSDKVNCKKH